LSINSYLFEAVVHPERAQISLQFSLRFSHLTSGVEASASVSVVLNQVAVWIDSAIEWDIFDLRNVVKSVLQNELAVVGYLKGYAYEVEIRRVLNRGRGIDYVFGIDIPCIAERNKAIELEREIAKIRGKIHDIEGVYLHRCFMDLVSAMKNPDDTGFYCYRAVESLRQHCASKYNVAPEKKAEQWEKLRELAKCDEATLREIKATADPVRHGDVVRVTSDDRVRLLTKTWDVVDAYINNC
jgi:hypothetical protein